ncbi:substrate-binding domain-containing protein [Dysgonomonas sp. OttesenSCG-928-D17]|nr:substrate-binding domain-containing protein [Dysgonomonas sp. OttesenSCG-928-D17]
MTNWKDAGGRNDDIKAYQRPKNSGSQTMLEHIMGNTPLAKPLETEMAGGMGDIITYTADYKNYKNAIGYSFLFFATEMAGNNQIELLKVDGIYPSRETVKSGQYPFTGDFYAITTDTQNPNVQRLIDWILSPQGQYLVEQTGYTPIQ